MLGQYPEWPHIDAMPSGPPGSAAGAVETPAATGRYTLTVTVIRASIDEPAPGFEESIRVDTGR
jgi:hypothetical protein